MNMPMTTMHFYISLYLMFQIRQKRVNGKNIYNLDFPGEFNFEQFKKFCDYITNETGPFESINYEAPEGIKIKEAMISLYRTHCNLLFKDNYVRSEDVFPEAMDKDEIDWHILKMLQCYQNDADEALLLSLYMISEKESFFKQYSLQIIEKYEMLDQLKKTTKFD